MRSIASLETMRPFLSFSAGSTSAGIRYATPVSSDHGHGNLYSRASHRASEAHPAASSDHLPIAARFARRVSVDSPPMHELGTLAQRTMNGSATTTRTAVEDAPGEGLQHGRRDISGGSGTTAVDSGEDTDASPSQHHVQFGELGSKKKAKSRLHPLFSNFSHSARNPEKETLPPAMESSTSVNAPRTFRHHLKNLVPPAPNKLHKVSIPDLQGSDGKSRGLAGPGWVVKDLPSDLKVVSEVVVKQILEGHQALSERLRVRYEEQFRKFGLHYSGVGRESFGVLISMRVQSPSTDTRRCLSRSSLDD